MIIYMGLPSPPREGGTFLIKMRSIGLVWRCMVWFLMRNKAIRDGRPRPPRHQVGWDIVRRECACQISWWSVEKWRRYYILKFHGNTFRWPTTLTFDLKFWKYLSVTEYPYSMCMLSFMMISWEMTEILHFEILRKHGQTHKHTNKQTWALQYLALPLWGAR